MTKNEFNYKANKLDRIARMIVIIYLSIFILIITFVFTGKSKTNNRTYVSYTVKENDRLWIISKKYLKNYPKDIREYIYEIKELNSISDEIYPGQSIEIPIYENYK